MYSPNLENRQILVVEDEDMNWYLLRDIIEMHNGTAIWADSGMKALDIIAGNDSIDMVLVDLNLPFMNGSKTVEKIKLIRPKIPIIAQTAFSEPGILKESLNAGCNSYILKPIQIEDLSKVFKQYLA